MKTTIGQYGQGFAGNTLAAFFRQHGLEVAIFDDHPGERNVATPADLVRAVGSGIIFVADPAPADSHGPSSLDRVQAALSHLNRAALEQGRRPITAYSATVPVGTTRWLQEQYQSLWLCYSPEFFTAAQVPCDFARAELILCGPPEVTCVVRELFHRADPARRVLEEERFEVGELAKHIPRERLGTTAQ